MLHLERKLGHPFIYMEDKSTTLPQMEVNFKNEPVYNHLHETVLKKNNIESDGVGKWPVKVADVISRGGTAASGEKSSTSSDRRHGG
jgi:hypothetical protein